MEVTLFPFYCSLKANWKVVRKLPKNHFHETCIKDLSANINSPLQSAYKKGKANLYFLLRNKFAFFHIGHSSWHKMTCSRVAEVELKARNLRKPEVLYKRISSTSFEKLKGMSFKNKGVCQIITIISFLYSILVLFVTIGDARNL